MSTGWSLDRVEAKPVMFSNDGLTAAIAPDAVLAFRLAETLAKRTQYGAFLCTRPDWTWFQTFAFRPIRGDGGPVTPDNHSEHAHSIAVDIRPFANPMRDDGVLITDFDTFGLEDGVAFVSAFLKAGFRWGGNWVEPFNYPGAVAAARQAIANANHKVRDGRIDTMHFELELTPDQVKSRDFIGEIAAALGAPPFPGRFMKFAQPHMQGTDVQRWKAELKRRGWRGMDDSDVFGGGASAATKGFQHNHGLAVDGVVGPATWTKAFSH
jgi:peptidoglycan hydrolase-like protein with peptidoglycan-binding domain